MSIQKTKFGTFEVRWKDAASKHRSKTFKRHADAKRHDRKMQDAADQGNRDFDPSVQNTLVADFYEGVFKPRFLGSATTLKQYEARWCPKKKEPEVWHLKRKWGRLRVRDANDPGLVAEWHQEMRRAGATAATMWRAHDMLTTLVGRATKWGYLTRYQIGDLAPEYQPKRPPAPWLPDSVEAIRADLLARVVSPPKGKRGGGVNGDAIPAYQWRRTRDATLVSVLGYEALRPGEALALKWRMLVNEDCTDIVTHLRITDRIPGVEDEDEQEDVTKTRRDRTVELEQATRDDLYLWWVEHGCPVGDGYVFPVDGDGERFTLGDWSNWRRAVWLPTLKRVGLDYTRAYHLRHSCVSMWLRQGDPLQVVARRAGHTISVCEATYEHEIEVSRHVTFSVTEAIAEARDSVVADNPALRDFYGVAPHRRRNLALALG